MVPDGGIDNIKLSNSDMMLFATANSGSMYSIKLPLLDCVQYSEFSVHSTTVTHVRVLLDSFLNDDKQTRFIVFTVKYTLSIVV